MTTLILLKGNRKIISTTRKSRINRELRELGKLREIFTLTKFPILNSTFPNTREK
ncbi:MAG: hypothetical protein F6J96_13890 [Symploca sp. SIO1C2]|nr:hypothetical protein [Symploca sp. SIO1C2]